MTTVDSRVQVPEVEALRAVGERLKQTIAPLTPADLDRKTPCKLWLLRDILAHLASGSSGVPAMWRAAIEGNPMPGFAITDSAKVNQMGVDQLRNDPDLLKKLDQALDGAMAELDRIVAEGKVDTVFEFFTRMPIRVAAGFFAADISVHLWDIGQAIGKTILPDPRILEAALPHLFANLPAQFIPEKATSVACTYGVKLTDIPNGEWVTTIDHGRITVERRPIADARVKTIADTPTFLLVSFGRLNPLKAMFSGKLKSQGNPLQGMKFPTYFHHV